MIGSNSLVGCLDSVPDTFDLPLRKSLRELKAKQGVVWFYRDAADPQVYRYALAEFMEDVAEYRIPIRTSSRPDYSDSTPLDGDGRLIQAPPS
jgi:hypothetical protein